MREDEEQPSRIIKDRSELDEKVREYIEKHGPIKTAPLHGSVEDIPEADREKMRERSEVNPARRRIRLGGGNVPKH